MKADQLKKMRDRFRKTRVKIQGAFDFEGNACNVIVRITKELEKIPVEHRATAYFDTYYNYNDTKEYQLCYTVTETDEEVDKRIEFMHRASIEQAERKLEHDRKEYERLKQKFEKK